MTDQDQKFNQMGNICATLIVVQALNNATTVGEKLGPPYDDERRVTVSALAMIQTAMLRMAATCDMDLEAVIDGMRVAWPVAQRLTAIELADAISCARRPEELYAFADRKVSALDDKAEVDDSQLDFDFASRMVKGGKA